MTDLENENARLRKELRDAKMEGNILKRWSSSFPRARRFIAARR